MSTAAVSGRRGRSDDPAERSDQAVVIAKDLRVSYGSGESAVDAVRGVDLTVRPGETVGIVGESGSGKSTLVMALAGLIPSSATIRSEELTVLGQAVHGRRRFGSDLLAGEVGVVYQDALRALNPVMRIGAQIEESLLARGWSRRAAEEHAIALLTKVGIPEPERRLRAYPHQLSGGMRQRVVIAMALSEDPRLIVADEPTTALDVTVQAQVLELIRTLSDEIGSATLLVTHDLGVVAGICDRVVVMYHGEIVEVAPVTQIFASPQHPYTRALIGAVPDPTQRRGSRLTSIPGAPPFVGAVLPGCSFADRCDHAVERCFSVPPTLTQSAPERQVACHRPEGVESGPVIIPSAPSNVGVRDRSDRDVLVEVVGLTHHYRIGGTIASRAATVHAVDDVSFRIHRGESLGLVGESGCGKSTLGRLLVGLERPTSGSIRFDGQEVTELRGARLRAFRRRSQMIHQDPRSSLNRRKTIRTLLAEPLRLRGVQRSGIVEEVDRLLETVGLSPRHAASYPHEFSGGQSQRLAIARSLALEPDFIVADEAVSALDVSVQGQVLNLLLDLRDRLGLTLLFVSHDLGVVRQVCDRVAVMYLGQIVEEGTVDQVFASPAHPYTFALRSAIPVPDPAGARSRTRVLLKGDPPRPTAPPQGCRFHPRCPIGPNADPGRTLCSSDAPALSVQPTGVSSACHFADRVGEELGR